MKTLNWPATSIPEGTLGRKSDLETALYARGLILPGEPILLEKLDAEANTVTLAAAIEPGMRAVSITVRSDTGVSGFVLPGDRVDVNEFIEEEPGQSAATLGGEAVRVNSRLIARPILKNVKVLAIDQTFEPGSGRGAPVEHGDAGSNTGWCVAPWCSRRSGQPWFGAHRACREGRSHYRSESRSGTAQGGRSPRSSPPCNNSKCARNQW